MHWFKLSSCNTVFFMIFKEFLRLRRYSSTFLVTWNAKWKRLWNSSQNFEFSIFNLKWFFFFLFFSRMVIFTKLFRRWPTFWNSMLKLRTSFPRCLTLIIPRWNTQRWFDVDLTLSYFVTSYQLKETLKQRWNFCWAKIVSDLRH